MVLFKFGLIDNWLSKRLFDGINKFIEGITNQDLPLLESLLHEDMLFVKKQL